MLLFNFHSQCNVMQYSTFIALIFLCLYMHRFLTLHLILLLLHYCVCMLVVYNVWFSRAPLSCDNKTLYPLIFQMSRMFRWFSSTNDLLHSFFSDLFIIIFTHAITFAMSFTMSDPSRCVKECRGIMKPINCLLYNDSFKGINDSFKGIIYR